MKTIGLVFPGQGSQYVGMGKSLYETHPETREIFETGSDITGVDLKKICFAGPAEVLTETSVCQISLFALDFACYAALKKNAAAFTPAFAAGHSLGEYAALAAAGAFSLEDGFRLVAKRALFMKAAAEKKPGTMAAVLGKKEAEIAQMLRDFQGVEISNLNSETQIVVGGFPESVLKFTAYLAEQKIKTVPLKVSGAFHTSLMQEASAGLAEEIKTIDFHAPVFSVYSNFTGEIFASSAAGIKAALLKQLVSPVRWYGIMKNFCGKGNVVTVELGPKRVLSNLISRTCAEALTLNVEDEATLSAAVKTLQEPLC